MRRDYFFDADEDRRMEKQNEAAWEALLRHVLEVDKEVNALRVGPWRLLDIGCHTGGMLEVFAKSEIGWRITEFVGVEPLAKARQDGQMRLRTACFYEEMEQLEDGSADVVISHEALYLVPDLPGWMKELKRVLHPDGAAFIVLSSHAENTAWMRWRPLLERRYGHVSYAYQPVADILDGGDRAGFDMEHKPLWGESTDSRRYSPPDEDGLWGFKSLAEARDFRKQKTIFTFYPKR